MSSPSTSTAEVHLVLQGGPVNLPIRSLKVAEPLPERVVVDFYGRHEHFARTGQQCGADDCAAPLFRWTHSTKIAE